MNDRFLVKLLLLQIALVLSTSSASGETLTVGGGDVSFQSIQAAINAASNGDLIRVRVGTYTGNLILTKQITLEGIGRPVLRGERMGSVITVLADGCAIRGFIIEHSGGDLTRKSTRLNSSHSQISYAVFCLKKKNIIYHML